jgi:hypothetical protein
VILLNEEALGREHHYNMTEGDEDLGVQLLNESGFAAKYDVTYSQMKLTWCARDPQTI